MKEFSQQKNLEEKENKWNQVLIKQSKHKQDKGDRKSKENKRLKWKANIIQKYDLKILNREEKHSKKRG